MKVAFVGMDHLGMVSSAVAARMGHEVLTVGDSDALFEPQLVDLLASAKDHIHPVMDLPELRQCEIIFISSDIGDRYGHGDMEKWRKHIEFVAEIALAPEAIMVILSQTPPGFVRSCSAVVASGRLFSQLDTLVFGEAVSRAMNPEQVLIGYAGPWEQIPTQSRETLLTFYHGGSWPLPKFVSYEAVEMAKISINAMLAASITMASTLAELGANYRVDWRDVQAVLRADKRIGSHAYLTPGLGIGGGHMMRDLSWMQSEDRLRSSIARTCIDRSGYDQFWLDRQLTLYPGDQPVAIWGLTYKVNTSSIVDSPAFAVMDRNRHLTFRVHDPVARVEFINMPATQFTYLADTLEGAGVVLILTPWDIYRSSSELLLSYEHLMVLDPYRVVGDEVAKALGRNYCTLGAP